MTVPQEPLKIVALGCGRRWQLKLALAQLVVCVLLSSHGLAQTTLPDTAPLTVGPDFAVQMVDGINQYLQKATSASVEQRGKLWNRNYQSAEAYEQSVKSNRDHLRRIIGAVDARLPVHDIVLDNLISRPGPVATGTGYKVYAVRWPVFEGVDGEGLLLQPDGEPVARVVAIPDADQTPEMLAGLAPGIEPAAQTARRLVEAGCQVLVPVLIDRSDTWSGIPGIGMTNQPHREWIYRMSYEVGTAHHRL